MTIATIIVFVGLLIFLAHLLTAMFSRTRIPDVLVLTLIGVALGPVLAIVKPAHLGVVGPVFTTITLIVILFEGGLGLHLDVLRKALRGATLVTITGFIVTMSAVAGVSIFIMKYDPLRAFLLGAILAGTSSAVVIPIIRHLSMKQESKTILMLESVLTDVLSIVVALALLEAYKLGELSPGTTIGRMAAMFIVAVLFGFAGGFVWSVFLQRVHTIQNSIFTTPAFVFIMYGLAELLGFSGAISALAFGVTLGNIEHFKLSWMRRFIPQNCIELNATEKAFFAEAVFLLKTFFFIFIGVSIRMEDKLPFIIGGIITAAVFIVRIPVIWLSAPRSTLRSDPSIMAIMVPKGLAPAVLASLPLQQGVAGGEMIQNVTYAVVLISISLTCILVFLVEKTFIGGFYGKLLARFTPTESPP